MKTFVYATVALLGLSLLSPADEPPKPTPTPPAAQKGTLPHDFKKLGLTDAQKLAVEKLTGEAKAKIADLEAQIQAIRDKEHADCIALLTDDQRKALKALLTQGVDDPVKDKAVITTPPAKDK